jgi:hypothetical protein
MLAAHCAVGWTAVVSMTERLRVWGVWRFVTSHTQLVHLRFEGSLWALSCLGFC